jgi:hypothetical protein
MAVADRPQTFVALRARHEAFQIASAVVRGHGVDVERLNCHVCGADLDWRLANEQICVDCPACGAVNELPCHLRYRVPPSDDSGDHTLDYASVSNAQQAWWGEAVPIAYVSQSEPAERAPMWLNFFCLTCLAVVLTTLALMAFHAYR